MDGSVKIMEEKRCRECDEFVRLFGGRNGGGRGCPKDATIPIRRCVYALDYACSNIIIDGNSGCATAGGRVA